MKFKNIEALNKNGNPYMRQPNVVRELNHKDVKDVLIKIAKKFGVNKIEYGVPLYLTLGLTKKQARKNYYYMLRGCDMPLSLLD